MHMLKSFPGAGTKSLGPSTPGTLLPAPVDLCGVGRQLSWVQPGACPPEYLLPEGGSRLLPTSAVLISQGCVDSLGRVGRGPGGALSFQGAGWVR